MSRVDGRVPSLYFLTWMSHKYTQVTQNWSVTMLNDSHHRTVLEHNTLQSRYSDAYHFSHLLSVCATLFHTMSVKSRQLPLLNFAAQDHFEANVPPSLSIVLLHLFLGISRLCCPWRFQLKNCFVLAEESFFNIRETHFHFYSFVYTATGFSCTYHVPTLITKQWMVFEFTCTKLSYYVRMRFYTKCKHKKLSSKHKFPVLYMPDIHFLPLETTSPRKKTLGIQKRGLAAFT